MNKTINNIFAISDAIRYVAIYCNGKLESFVKPNLADVSSSESDKYEELLVNPTILTLTKQRGELDCGGMEFVLIKYGNFYQFVMPINGGHVSVAIESKNDPLVIGRKIQKLLSLNNAF